MSSLSLFIHLFYLNIKLFGTDFVQAECSASVFPWGSQTFSHSTLKQQRSCQSSKYQSPSGCIFLECCPASLAQTTWAGNPPPTPAFPGKPGLQLPQSPHSPSFRPALAESWDVWAGQRMGGIAACLNRIFREFRIKENSPALLFHELQ